jgi:hypothetical protein
MKKILNIPVLLIKGIGNIFRYLFNFILSIFKAITKKIKSPFHSSTSSYRGLLISLGVGIGIFVLIFIGQPFGLNNLNEKTEIAISLGIISFICMLVFQFLLPYILKDFYDFEKWTLGKQLLQSSLMLAAILFSGLYFLSQKSGISLSYPSDVVYFFIVGLIPVLIFTLSQEAFHSNKYKKKAEEIKSGLNSKEVIQGNNPLKVLVFQGENQKLSLIPNQLIYARISKNESEFYYQNLMGIDKSIIKIEEITVRKELKDHPQFMAFKSDILLNVNAIQNITGTARGYEIAIAKVNEQIKVPSKYKSNLEKI